MISHRILFGTLCCCMPLACLLGCGSDDNGGSGSGDELDGGDESNPPAVATVPIAVGISSTCAITPTGAVKCWGENRYGELGDGTTQNKNSPNQVQGLESGAVQIAAGTNYFCALTSGQEVFCWGLNDAGQLGDGTVTKRTTPAIVTGLDFGAIAIVAGDNHTCAITPTGSVRCWGYNGFGRLGDGTTQEKHAPSQVAGLESGAQAVSAGTAHACAITSTGAVKCWGMNMTGQLGDGTTDDSPIPVQVEGFFVGATWVAAGGKHSCALTATGDPHCWGENSNGQLGDPSVGEDMATGQSEVPVLVLGMGSETKAISTGDTHTCAITSDGAVKCWGYNGLGQLGDGTTERRETATFVVGMSSGAEAISAGRDHTCAMLAGGVVKCWGANSAGQLGDGTSEQRESPVQVVGFP